MTTLYHHPTIPQFRAPAYAWEMVNGCTYANTEEVSLTHVPPGALELIKEGWARQQDDGVAALVWAAEAIRDKNRHADEIRTRHTEAAALKKLANSLSADTELLLAKLPPRLRERVRQLT